jgi:serine/threonine protein phosphatase PrpC
LDYRTENLNYKVQTFSQAGRNRFKNEDGYLVNIDIGLFAVADGVGSLPHGEMASTQAVFLLEKAIKEVNLDENVTQPFGWESGVPLRMRALKYAVRSANSAIYDIAKNSSSEMGTTLSAVWLDGNRMYIAHVGDSRIYLVRNGRTIRLTEDHTILAEKMKLGILKDNDIKDSGVSNTITRAVGHARDLEVDSGSTEVRQGDVIILCTDGMYRFVKEFEITEIIKKSSPEEAVTKMMEMALRRGSDDDLTVVTLSAS